ncbi:abc-type nitrate sulfonate bicarbonate transport atpase component [Leptolyngbya sp. Heron Island J]|uniref:ABC transporter ATP-binding protein n=1 Tax=Leptolyngbya sp. Heron Island J TaxID=1385935 RepID=UPI0003B96D48|nr:ABC transporter ATP-binding protein [Leptolyngbya sp. Heron Island J]ESA39153.1 abc-type nitrate sulfonate bicarbonate transport atpase component [Leptolyngbya sp. Heron Island J]
MVRSRVTEIAILSDQSRYSNKNTFMTAAMSASLLALQTIDKIYPNGTVALQGVDLTVGAGEFISLVGPSGCGKSTVLKLVAGLGTPTDGAIHWQCPPEQHNLAFVFQDPALMPWASVVDNIHLPLKLKGQSLRSVRAKIQAAINTVDLCGCENSYPRQLSGGMKMRVSIARALVTKPHILLMDEPFGALDEMTRSRLNSDLLHLWEEKHWTVLFVTHNIYEAVYLSTRVIVMAARPGRVVADIPIEATYPRTEAFRTSSHFNHYCREIMAALSVAESIGVG